MLTAGGSQNATLTNTMLTAQLTPFHSLPTFTTISSDERIQAMLSAVPIIMLGFAGLGFLIVQAINAKLDKLVFTVCVSTLLGLLAGVLAIFNVVQWEDDEGFSVVLQILEAIPLSLSLLARLVFMHFRTFSNSNHKSHFIHHTLGPWAERTVLISSLVVALSIASLDVAWRLDAIGGMSSTGITIYRTAYYDQWIFILACIAVFLIDKARLHAKSRVGFMKEAWVVTSAYVALFIVSLVSVIPGCWGFSDTTMGRVITMLSVFTLMIECIVSTYAESHRKRSHTVSDEKPPDEAPVLPKLSITNLNLHFKHQSQVSTRSKRVSKTGDDILPVAVKFPEMLGISPADRHLSTSTGLSFPRSIAAIQTVEKVLFRPESFAPSLRTMPSIASQMKTISENPEYKSTSVYPTQVFTSRRPAVSLEPEHFTMSGRTPSKDNDVLLNEFQALMNNQAGSSSNSRKTHSESSRKKIREIPRLPEKHGPNGTIGKFGFNIVGSDCSSVSSAPQRRSLSFSNLLLPKRTNTPGMKSSAGNFGVDASSNPTQPQQDTQT